MLILIKQNHENNLIMPEFKRFSNKNSQMTLNPSNICKSKKLFSQKWNRKIKIKNKVHIDSNFRILDVNPRLSASSSIIGVNSKKSSASVHSSLIDKPNIASGQVNKKNLWVFKLAADSKNLNIITDF